VGLARLLLVWATVADVSSQQEAVRASFEQLIAAMLNERKSVSDLIFSPGRAPQIESNGELIELPFPGLEQLTADHTSTLATLLTSTNPAAREQLDRDGSADLSYAAGNVRFRVNVFRQRAAHAIVMRVIPSRIPTFSDLALPDHLNEIVPLRNGIVLVTGPTGSGKSSTLAAIVDRMNDTRAIHILTIEDPIEFLHQHKRATIHQRELHSDIPTFGLGLRAALRQAPKVILVGEMRDRETIETALEAAETGHLVLSTLHTIDAAKTVERIVGTFPLGDQQTIRTRLAKALQYILSQRLLPKADGSGRVAIIEILKATLRTREYIEQGEKEGKTLLDAMRAGAQDGMQHFDGEIERLIRAGVINLDTGLSYSTNASNLRLQIADLLEDRRIGIRLQTESDAKAFSAAAIDPADILR
jgi:twitching motility protein PilT